MARCAPIWRRFYIKTVDELAVLENFKAGRTVDQNIGETTRRGVELASRRKVGGRLQCPIRVHLHPRSGGAGIFHLCHGALQSADQSQAGRPPANYLPVNVGNRYLPAIAQNSVYLGLTWSLTPAWGFSTTLD